MLEKIKEDIDKDLPKIGRLMDEAGDDIVKKNGSVYAECSIWLRKIIR
jgi:hypothetical protein